MNKNTTAIGTHLRFLKIKELLAGLFASMLFPFMPTIAQAAPFTPEGKKVFIVYYSWGGNTRQVASQIQKSIQADVVELKTITPYPEEYRPTTVQAQKEPAENYLPPLSTTIGNLDDYDVVIIGSPNWWGTLAMPVFTFLDTYNLSSKAVALYITHEGSHLGRSTDDLKRLCPQSTLLDGLAIRGGSVASSQRDVDAWLKKIGLL